MEPAYPIGLPPVHVSAGRLPRRCIGAGCVVRCPRMKISEQEVRDTALLARLALTDAELAQMTRELDAILGYMETLKAVDVSGVEPTTHAVPLDCPLVADTLGPQLEVDQALADAPARTGALFEVPKIIEVAE